LSGLVQNNNEYCILKQREHLNREIAAFLAIHPKIKRRNP
jgi:hypothetical protein